MHPKSSAAGIRHGDPVDNSIWQVLCSISLAHRFCCQLHWDKLALPKSACAGIQQKELAWPGKGAKDKPHLSLTLLLC